MYNTYSFIYQEISKLYDLDEFQELDNIENYLENTEINIENIFKNNLQSIVHLYQEFSNFQNSNYFLDDIVSRIDFQIKSLSSDVGTVPLDYMYYLRNDITSIGDEENYLSYLGIYLKNIFGEDNIFKNYAHLLIICDYSTTNENIYFYPGHRTEINSNLNKGKIKEYAIKKIKEKINDFTMLKQILIHEIDYYNNLFLLPYFDDDNYSENNDLEDLTSNIFDTTTYPDLKINNIAFMLLPSNQNNEELNYNNLEDNIEKIFLLIGTEDISNKIYEEIKRKNKINEVNLLRTNYLFPYELIGSGSCENILYLGKSKDTSQIIEYKYLDQCFDKKEKLEKLDGYDKYEDFTTYSTHI